MIDHKTLRVAIAAIAMTAIPSTASACQGIQFESRLVWHNGAALQDIPEDQTQYRVRLHERDLRDAGARDLIRLTILPGENGYDAQDRSSVRSLMLVKPVGTSCSSATIPPAGDYFVVGRIVRNEEGNPILINGGALFYPAFRSVSAMRDLLPKPQ